MSIKFIISQIIGLISFIISLMAYHKNEKKGILKNMIISNILNIVHYLLLYAYSGCITKIMAIIRDEIIIKKEDNRKLNKPYILVIIMMIYILIGIFTFEKIYSVLPIIAATIYLLFIWNGDKSKIKKIAFYSYFIWLVYNICIISIAGIISNIVAIISTYIAIKKDTYNNFIKNI